MGIEKYIKRVKNWTLTDVMTHLPVAMSKAGNLGQYVQEFKELLSLLQDYSTGKYRAISTSTLSLVIFAVAYVILPVDCVPDFLPVLGFGDDLAFLAAVLCKVHGELDAYKTWKESENNPSNPVRTARGRC
ncbi:MAG: DUF1232 domain-containing protein [Thermoguttaceae bacterium]|nr:DUF1232 domain-containing protein [Thermoguttaceae bacterium]MDO4858710.1 DUF1232 domain-containing protein [Thermoguttaceae bacterium]